MRTLLRFSVAAALLIAPLPARAAVEIVAVPGSYVENYATPVVVWTGVTTLSFINTDIQEHDVVSDDTRAPGSAPWCPANGPRCPLFFSELIGPATIADIQGLDDVPTGTYIFHCSPHAWMTGTLVIARPPAG